MTQEGHSGPRVKSWVADGIGHLRLSRPTVRNAIDAETVQQARDAIDAFVREGVCASVLEADGPVFCAGGDRAEAGTTARSNMRLVETIVSSSLFWAARVDGPAVGGGVAVAVVCPLVVLTPNAWLELPEARQGFLPTPVLAYLEPLVGPRLALEICLSAERIGAERAVALGLAQAVVAADRIDGFILERLASLVHSPKVARAASRAWQAHFSSDAFRSRYDALTALV